MAAIGDIYELKHVQKDFDNSLFENVYFYRQVADPVGGSWPTQSQRLAEDWMLDVWPVIQPTIPTSYGTTELRVRNLFNLTDSYVMPLAVAGTRSAAGTELQPSFMSGVITLAVDNGLVKKGRKMIAGILESDTHFNTFSVLGIAMLAVRAASMLLGISTLVGGSRAFEPVVVKRIREGTPGNYTYRLPTSQAEAIFGNIVSAVASTVVSGQDTRKL